MLACPESIYDFENMSIKQLTNLARYIKGQITRYKKEAVKAQNCEIDTLYQLSQTHIIWCRECLRLIELQFLTRKVAYPYSKADLKAIAFQDAIQNISKIIFCYCGFFGTNLIVEADFDNENAVKLYHAYRNSTIEELRQEGLYQIIPKAFFLSELEKLYIGEWKKTYVDHYVLDGAQWELEIQYKDGKKHKIYGSNDYPYNFNELLDLLDVHELLQDEK